MKSYIGTKQINATPMTREQYNNIRGWAVPSDENPEDTGYLVEYPDSASNCEGYAGYISWSPQAVFEKSYMPTDGLTFGLALDAVNLGKRISRKGWNGKGLYVSIWHCDEISHSMLLICNNNIMYTWVPSSTDLMALDWMIVE
ncbi:DUF2829 domain-containing protein [Yersinia enterocolitica]